MTSYRSTAVRAALAAGAVLVTGAMTARTLLAPPAPAVRPVPSLEPAVVAAAAPSRGAGAGAGAADASIGGAHPLAPGLRVTNITGPVERRARGSDAWRAVQRDETIALNEALRTGSGGAAVLELADHTTIWLWPESEVSAERLDDELARVGVAGGRLDLNVPRNDARAVEVAAEGGATARTQGARFSIIVDGAHVATVATREGEVDVVSGTGRVRVPPGMQTRARPGQAPEVVAPIPTELLLAVDWPSTALRSRTTTLRGRAPAGVLVSVGGVRVVVAEDGTFEREVALREGENRVEVTAVDVVGRRVVRRSPPLRVDTQAPAVGTRGRWE